MGAVAEADIKAAFRHFLKEFCTEGRPFVIGGYSQGGHLVRHLLRDIVEPDETLRSRMVCAYVLGCSVGQDTFPVLRIASGETDVGCVIPMVSTNANNAKEMKNELTNMVSEMPKGTVWTRSPVSVNPLSWSTDATASTHDQYQGGLDLKTGELLSMSLVCRAVNKDAVATESGGVLVVTGDMPANYVDEDMKACLHPCEGSWCYMNLRSNLEKRLAAWQNAKKMEKNQTADAPESKE